MSKNEPRPRLIKSKTVRPERANRRLNKPVKKKGKSAVQETPN